MDERVPARGPLRPGCRAPQAPGAVQLASREDFRLGLATIRPSLRTVEGPQGSAVIEPRVMQVLVAFADAGGVVLTRDDLMRSCWGGSIVSEDAVNRTVAEIRRIARQTGSGFGIETIPRVGYRLEVGSGALADGPEVASREALPPDPSGHGRAAPAAGEAAHEEAPAPRTLGRRWVAGGLAAAALAGTAVALGWKRPVRDPVFDEAMAEGLRQLMMEYAGKGKQGVEQFTAAVGRRPDDARAWGLLALAHANEADFNVAGALQECEKAAAQALKLDPREPNATVALALARREQEGWAATERQFRAALGRDRDNRWALTNLMFLLQASGYNRESREVNEQILDVDRREHVTTPGVLARQAMKLWIKGDHDGAQRMAEYAWLKAFPGHSLVYKAALVVYTHTGRFEAARQHVQTEIGERELKPDGMRLYLMGLDAMESPTPANREKVREGFLNTDRQGYFMMMHGILLLSQVHEVDAAYELFDGIVASRGPQVVSQLAQDPQWRKTLWLFTPAMRSFRADPRIRQRTRSLGLDDYWDARGVEPDEGRIYRWPEFEPGPGLQRPTRT